MELRLEALSTSELNDIHRATLEVLKKTGVQVDSEELVALLKKSGAKTDGNRVTFPCEMVEKAINQINQTVVLSARDRKHTLTLPSNRTLNSTSGYAAQVHDMDTGETRESTAADLKQFAVLADALDQVDFFWPIAMPTEIESPQLQEVAALDIAFRNNTKHIQCSVSDGETALWQIKLAAALQGGEEKLKENPMFSVVSSPFTPLIFKKGASEAYMHMARAGVPVVPMNVPMAGTTAPVTLAGAIVMTNAEQLATLMILKSVDKDAPMVYSSDTGTAGMSDGGMNYESPDVPVLNASMAQVARFYQIPSCVCHDSGEEKCYEIPAGFENNGRRIAISNMAHSDLAAWMGSLDEALGASLWDLLLDAEVLKLAKEINRSFEVNENTLAVDVINQVGPGGHFLSNKHTSKNFRSQVSLYDIRKSFVFSGGDFVENAKDKVREILASHKPVPVAEDRIKAMDQVMEEARRVL